MSHVAPDFQRILQSAPSSYLVVDLDWIIVAASDAYLRVTMTARDEIVGRHFFTVFPDNPDDPAATGAANLRASIERVVANRRSDALALQKYDIRRPVGAGGEFEPRYWQFESHPVFGDDGRLLYIILHVEDVTELVDVSPLPCEEGFTISATMRDISERKRLAAATKLMVDRLTSAVESIQDAFALFDDNDNLVLCNSAYRSLFGNSADGPATGSPYAELLEAWIGHIDFADAEAAARFRSERLTRRRNESTTVFDVRMRDGRNLRVIDRRTAEGGIVKTVWDLTEDERRAEELREARALAEAGSAAKSEFLASMSHELRTPLNAILGFAQLLQLDKQSPLSNRQKEHVFQILKGGEHLLRLIDDILDLSRIEAGGVSISTEPVNVLDVLSEVKRTLEPMAAGQDVRIDVQWSGAELPMVSADRTRLAQILMNFGSNAIKYNRRGGRLTFLVEMPASEIVRVSVHDTGLGIPQDKQSKLFQPFQRAGQEMGSIQGTGIGLVITKRLAQLMNGDVGFRSIPGEGSVFWVDIPEGRPRPLSSVQPASTSVATRRTEGGGTVLYVEDNPANVSFMRALMETFENVELLVAQTAEVGVGLARTRVPDVIIMDVNLPGMSGIEALGTLRSNPATRAIPVIALSAAATERDQRRGAQAGFHRYLTKPVKVDQFLTVLEPLLGAEWRTRETVRRIRCDAPHANTSALSSDATDAEDLPREGERSTTS